MKGVNRTYTLEYTNALYISIFITNMNISHLQKNTPLTTLASGVYITIRTGFIYLPSDNI
nr:MAG TPA: hypothetical protein [Caudoviricetes sp.]